VFRDAATAAPRLLPARRLLLELFGWGGAKSREYCPRGKPAAEVICRWYGAKPGACRAPTGKPWFDEKR